MNLTDFPYEVLFNILLNAKPKDIANYCQTSRGAFEICRDQSFWRMKLWKDYGQQKQVEGMTWKQQYQLRPIRVINSPIAAGRNFYGIIDDRGNLYMAGYNEWGQLGDGTKRFRSSLQKVDLKSKVVSVTTGLYTNRCSFTTGVVTEDGEVYFWGTLNSILVPQQLGFPRPGKIVKFVFENSGFKKGIIMDNGLAYLVNSSEEIILIPANKGTKIVDLVIPMPSFWTSGMTFVCFFLDNYGNVFFFHVSSRGETKMVKVDLPDPIRQLSGTIDNYFGLSIKGDVYTWGYETLAGTERKYRKDYISSFDPSPFMTLTFCIQKADIPAFVVSISSGYVNVASVTSDGTVYVWGYNYSKRLVSGDDEEKLLSSGKMIEKLERTGDYKSPFIKLPLELRLESKIKSISLGGVFTIALTENGVINYWGTTDMTPKNTI